MILLDPQSARLHSLAAPIYRHAIEENIELASELVARGKALEAAGYHVQVKVTEGSTLLFLDVDGKRIPLRQRDHAFAAGNRTFAVSELLALLESEPQRFSANALLRAVVQDYLLPTAAYLGGPAEVAYFAQAEVIYKRLGVTMPAVLPRPSFTLVEPSVQRMLRSYGLELGDFFAGGQKLRGKMETAHLPKGLAGRFDRGEKTLRATLEKLREPVGRVDATLLGALENAEKKMLYQFGNLRGRAARAEAFRTGVIDRHEKLLTESLFPHHGLQERSLCFLPFLARHGAGLLEELFRRAAAHPAPGCHDVVVL
jgi:bacillithiol biosynthesis cysteine-adding enzyme BshC